MKLYGIIVTADDKTYVRPELHQDERTAQEVIDLLAKNSEYETIALVEYVIANPEAEPPNKTDQQKLIDTLTEIGIPHTVDDDMVNIGTEVMMDEMSYAQVKFDSYGKFTELD